jgi:hypothetical protein
MAVKNAVTTARQKRTVSISSKKSSIGDITTEMVMEANNNKMFAEVIDCFSKAEYKKLSLKDLETMSQEALFLTQDGNFRRSTQNQRMYILKASRAIRNELDDRQAVRTAGVFGFLRGIIR